MLVDEVDGCGASSAASSDLDAENITDVESD